MRISLFLKLVAFGFPCLAAMNAAADDTASAKAASAEKVHAAGKVDPLDWPQWRGPEQNGISRETGLVDSLDPEGENLLWKSEELAGRSTPIVMNGKIYTIVAAEPETPREGEKVICANAQTGKVLWENRFNVYLSDVPLERVGWSCCTGDPANNRVYAMGVGGLFLCLDAETGETKWSRSLAEECGLITTYGGRTNTPVLFEDLVIISAVFVNWGDIDPKWSYQKLDARTGGWGDMPKPSHRYLAMNKETGKTVWFNGTRLLPDNTTYSTPVLTVLDGQAAMVVAAGDGAAYAIQPRTGNLVWKYQFSGRGMNVTPLVVGDTVYICQSEENRDDRSMGAVAAINGVKKDAVDITATNEMWRLKEIMVGKSSPLYLDGRLYAVDDGAGLFIFDTAAGQTIGPEGRAFKKFGTMMRASLLWADGKIYLCETNGRCFVLEPTEEGVSVVSQCRLPSGQEVHGTPIVSHGRIYLPTTGALYCLGKADHKPVATDRPEAPAERDVDDKKLAHVQVLPADLLLRPGQQQQFSVRLFNAAGQEIAQEDAVFSSDQETITESGLFTAKAEDGHRAAIITAKVGELEGKSRVRIVPPLPWKFDFSDEKVPVTWVGARYRHITLDYDLLKALEKKDPLAAKLYIFTLTTFTNAGKSEVTLDDNPPLVTWSALQKFCGLVGKVRTLDEAKTVLDPSLGVLVSEKILASYTWGQAPLGSGQPAPPKPKAEDPKAPAAGQGETEQAQDAPAEPPPSTITLALVRGPRKWKNSVMTKITTIPRGTRSQFWMGPTDLHDYTIQADLCAHQTHNKFGDMGLHAMRYTLDMMGASHRLQIRTWPSQTPDQPDGRHRMSQNAHFDWKPNAWYTLKLRAALEDGKTVLKGKVWKRGAKEPSAWTIEAEDDQPNLEGSPGLFGNATDSELFIDNIVVTSNS